MLRYIFLFSSSLPLSTVCQENCRCTSNDLSETVVKGKCQCCNEIRKKYMLKSHLHVPFCKIAIFDFAGLPRTARTSTLSRELWRSPEKVFSILSTMCLDPLVLWIFQSKEELDGRVEGKWSKANQTEIGYVHIHIIQYTIWCSIPLLEVHILWKLGRTWLYFVLMSSP